jgi:hypothetical protein
MSKVVFISTLVLLLVNFSYQAPDIPRGYRMLVDLGLRPSDNKAIIERMSQNMPDLCQIHTGLSDFVKSLSNQKDQEFLTGFLKDLEQSIRLDAVKTINKLITPRMLQNVRQIDSVLFNSFGLTLSENGEIGTAKTSEIDYCAMRDSFQSILNDLTEDQKALVFELMESAKKDMKNSISKTLSRAFAVNFGRLGPIMSKNSDQMGKFSALMGRFFNNVVG